MSESDPEAMKLGFILEPSASNSSYRVITPMLALERRGHRVAWPADTSKDIPLQTLLRCDLVHCFRRPDRISDLKLLSAHGVAVTFDNDDDLRAIDVSSSGGRTTTGARGHLQNRRKFANMLKIARFADMTTTPSHALAATYRSAGATDVTVVENYLDHRSFPGYGRRVRHDGFVVGWVASKEHEMDLSHLPITDAVRHLLDRHQELRVLTVGSRLPLDSPRYEFRKDVQFAEIVRLCSGFDIGIAPLADTEFNRARSNVKLKEYAAGGTPWLASPVGPYVGMGSREGGRLVENGCWFDALDSLVRSAFTRRLLSRRALRWAKEQTIESNAVRWEQAFSKAIARAHARTRQERVTAAR